jgi:hypothetical protein
MSFGGGSQGTVRYALVMDTAQAERSLGTFKASLASIAPATQNINRNLGTASTGLKTLSTNMGANTKATQQLVTQQKTLETGLKTTTTSINGQTKAAQQMANGQTTLQASIKKTTADTSKMSAENAKLQQQIFKTSGVTQSFGSKVKDAGSKFGGLAVGLSATATSALQLAAGFRDYGDAQIAVDRANRKLSLGQEALVKAQDKLNALQAKGVTSGKEYEQAQLDVKQAQQQVEIQTQLVGEAQERMFDAQTQFVASVIPTALGAFGTLTSAVKDVGLNMDKLKGGIGGLKGALGGLGGLGSGLGLVGPIGLAVAACALLIMKLEEMKKSVTDAFHEFGLKTVDTSFLGDFNKTITDLNANISDTDEILKRVGAKSMADLQKNTKEYIKTAIDLGAVVDKTGHFMETTTDRTFKLSAGFKESTATWIHWMEMYKEKGETPIQILERLKKAGMDEATAKKIETAAEEDYQNKQKAGLTVRQQATTATNDLTDAHYELGQALLQRSNQMAEDQDLFAQANSLLQEGSSKVDALGQTWKVVNGIYVNITDTINKNSQAVKNANVLTEIQRRQRAKADAELFDQASNLTNLNHTMIDANGNQLEYNATLEKYVPIVKQAKGQSDAFSASIQKNWEEQDKMNSMNDENLKKLLELNTVYGTNRTVMNTNVDMIGKLHSATIGVRDAYIDEEFSLLALATKYGVATVKMQDMTLNYVDNTRRIKDNIAASLDWSAAFTDLKTKQDLFDEGVFKGVVQLKEWADNVVIANQQQATFKAGLIDLGNTVFANAIPKGIQLTVEQMQSLIISFNDAGKYAEELGKVFDTVFSKSRQALQELVDAAVKGGKDWKEKWKDIKDTIPKNLRDDFKDFVDAQADMGKTLEKVVPKLEAYRQIWDKLDAKEQASATKDMAKAMEDLRDPLEDIAGTDVTSKIIDPLLKLKEGGLTKDELNTWEQFFNLYQTLSEEGGGLSDEDVTILQNFVANHTGMSDLATATQDTADSAANLSPEMQKVAENKILKGILSDITVEMDRQTKSANLQGRAIRGLTGDVNQLVLIMQKMVNLKGSMGGGGGGGGDGFSNIVYTTDNDGQIPESPRSPEALAREEEKRKLTTPAVAQLDISKATANITRLIDNYAGYIKFVSTNEPMARLNITGAVKKTTQLIGDFAGYLKYVSTNEPMARINITKAVKNITRLIGDFNGYVKAVNQANPVVKIDITKAVKSITRLIGDLEGIPNITRTVTINATGSGLKYAQHGMHETLASDTMIMAHKGERVDIGPHSASGGGGGGGGSGGHIVVNLTNIISDKEIIRTYRRELGKEMYRFGPT